MRHWHLGASLAVVWHCRMSITHKMRLHKIYAFLFIESLAKVLHSANCELNRCVRCIRAFVAIWWFSKREVSNFVYVYQLLICIIVLNIYRKMYVRICARFSCFLMCSRKSSRATKYTCHIVLDGKYKIRNSERVKCSAAYYAYTHFESLAFSVFMNKLIGSCNSHELRTVFFFCCCSLSSFFGVFIKNVEQRMSVSVCTHNIRQKEMKMNSRVEIMR